MIKSKVNYDFLNHVDFHFDSRLKDHHFSTQYFLNTIRILNTNHKIDNVSMQFIHFHKGPVKVCGIAEVIQLIKFVLTPDQLSKIKVYSVNDGDILTSVNEPLLVINGPYQCFGFLENIIDGILNARCSVATNTMKVLQELGPKQKAAYMADRVSWYANHPYDAYSAYVGGIRSFCTISETEFFANQQDFDIVGTMPHSLIQMYQGNYKDVIDAYTKTFQRKPILLIDYHNDILTDLLELGSYLDKIRGIRIDTSSKLVDKSLQPSKRYGVNYYLVKKCKQWLIDHGYSHLQIIVSSGMTPQKIKSINRHEYLVDSFGVGAYLLTPSVHISADLVELNHHKQAKVGRKKLNWSHLEQKI